MNDVVDRKVEPHDQGSRLETNHWLAGWLLVRDGRVEFTLGSMPIVRDVHKPRLAL